LPTSHRPMRTGLYRSAETPVNGAEDNPTLRHSGGDQREVDFFAREIGGTRVSRTERGQPGAALNTPQTKQGEVTKTNRDIIRAWTDAAFRAQLSAEQRAALPANPAGMVELSAAELTEVGGGGGTGVPTPEDLGYTKQTWPCCETVTIVCDNRTVGGN